MRRPLELRRHRLLRVGLLSGGLLLEGCRHQEQVAYAPPLPKLETRTAHGDGARNAAEASGAASVSAPAPAWQPGDLDGEAAAAPAGYFDDFHGSPVFSEVGEASWYGPNYNRHNAADGTVYDQNAMTAAHRTLPLGSTVRVTNVRTGEQVLVRINDRGPFAPGRVIDLSMGAAKAIGIYRLGVAQVQVEAFAHVGTDPAGRWCVQTGAFKTQTDALDLKAALMERYKAAKVISFAGPTGYWVRIDPATRSREQAEEMLQWIGNPDPAAAPYLVRTD